MIDALRNGTPHFSESMGLQGYYFPSLLVKMIDAGEHAGGMDRTFREMADYYQDLKQTRNRVYLANYIPSYPTVSGVCDRMWSHSHQWVSLRQARRKINRLI